MVYKKDKNHISPRKISQWIAENLRKQISSGELTAKLPSEKELAKTFDVNFKTVAKAIGILVDEGLVYRQRPQGTFVSSHSASLTGKKVAIMVRTRGHLFADFAGRLLEILGQKGYTSLVYDTQFGEEANLNKKLKNLIAEKPDIAVVDNSKMYESDLKLLEANVPKVIYLTGRPKELDLGKSADFVLSDDWLGGYIATKHLISLGCKKIMMLSNHIEPKPMTQFRHESHYKLINGYRDALIEAGLEKNFHFFPCKSDGSERQEFKKLLLSSKLPDGIFASADNRIAQHLKLFREVGLRIPDDIALVGYYDTPWSRDAEIPFSSVNIRMDLISQALFEHIEGKRHGTTLINPELVVR